MVGDVEPVTQLQSLRHPPAGDFGRGSEPLDLEVAGKSEKALLRAFQMHPFKPLVLHVDFQRVSATDKIHVKVPLHFMNQETYETMSLDSGVVGDDRFLLADNVLIQVQTYNGKPIGVQFPPHVELAVKTAEPGVRGDTASGGVTKVAVLETGLEVRVPLFIKEGEKIKVHTETREFAGRA